MLPVIGGVAACEESRGVTGVGALGTQKQVWLECSGLQ